MGGGWAIRRVRGIRVYRLKKKKRKPFKKTGDLEKGKEQSQAITCPGGGRRGRRIKGGAGYSSKEQPKTNRRVRGM